MRAKVNFTIIEILCFYNISCSTYCKAYTIKCCYLLVFLFNLMPITYQYVYMQQNILEKYCLILALLTKAENSHWQHNFRYRYNSVDHFDRLNIVNIWFNWLAFWITPILQSLILRGSKWVWGTKKKMGNLRKFKYTVDNYLFCYFQNFQGFY